MPAMAMSGRALLLCLCLAPGFASRAQPLPPQRPRSLGEAPSAKPEAEAPNTGAESDHPLRNLEHADMRLRVKACAMRWMSMKREGATGGVSWSEFSRSCLQEAPK